MSYYKKQSGGMDCNDFRVFNNSEGTCWCTSIMQIFIFSNITSEIVQKNLSKKFRDIFIYIYYNKPELLKFLPKKFINEKNLMKLKNMFENIKKRANIKDEEPEFISIPQLRRYDSVEEEKKLLPLFFDLYNMNKEDYSQYFISSFYFILFFSVFLYNNIVSIIYVPSSLLYNQYTDGFHKQKHNFESINLLIGVDKVIGILCDYRSHVACFYKCKDKMKFYNNMNERVYTFDYSKLFEKLSELQQGQNRFKIYSQSSLFVIKNDNDESYLFNGYNDIVYFSTTSDNKALVQLCSDVNEIIGFQVLTQNELDNKMFIRNNLIFYLYEKSQQHVNRIKNIYSILITLLYKNIVKDIDMIDLENINEEQLIKQIFEMIIKNQYDLDMEEEDIIILLKRLIELNKIDIILKLNDLCIVFKKRKICDLISSAFRL